ncbi:serine protease [Herbaspirillum sp. HC18]|nr:serine protease [Herbaspirillum sp. HC18]
MNSSHDAAPSGPDNSSMNVADAVEAVAASVVGLGTRRGLAAGVVWKTGMVVTAASAIGHAQEVHVVQPDGETAPGRVRGTDPATDLALIALEDERLRPAVRRIDSAVRVGDFVFAAGRDASGMLHASFGRIGATGGAWRTWRGGAVDRFVRLDGGLYPGLTGAPVGDARGQVIGVASPMLSRHHGVVLPVATVDRVSEALSKHGRVAHGFLGIVAQPVTVPAGVKANAPDLPETGLLVTGVADDAPAAQAGVMVGDILLTIGGHPIRDINSLREALGAEQIGTRMRLQLLRGGQAIELIVEVAERQTAYRC